MSSLEDLSCATQIRLPTIKCGLRDNWTQTKTAKELKVSSKTIYRDIKSWVRTSDFITWSREIFANKIGKVSHAVALKAATSIIVKDMATKAEIKSVKELRKIEVVWHVNSKTTDKLPTTP